MIRCSNLLLAMLAWTATAGAQTHVMSGPVDPLAVPKWEDVFAEGPFDLPDESTEVGDVSPVLTAANAAANAACRLGLAALHRFDDREAERAFRLAITRDETSAFGYLGLALANDALPGRASVFWKRAKSHLAMAGAFERRLVETYEPFFSNLQNRLGGLAPTATNLDEISGLDQPGAEATALLVRWEFQRDQDDQARERLDQLLAARPKHPAATYRLRLVDPADPADPTRLSERLAACPPNPGALRMAADRLKRAGRFGESAHFLRAAALVASARHPSDMEEWRLVEEVREEEVAMLASAGQTAGLKVLAKKRTAAVREAFLRLERWADILALPAPAAKAPLIERAADTHARALAAFSLKQPEMAFPSMAALQVLTAEARRPAAGTTAQDTQRLEDWEAELQLHNLLDRGTGGDVAARVGSLRTVPPLRRARLALVSGQAQAAADEARRASQSSFHALPETAMLIEALMALGRKEDARALFRSPFGTIVPDAPPEEPLPALSRLAPIAVTLGLPEHWWPKSRKREAVPRLDVAASREPDRPDSELPAWALPDGTGAERSLPSLIKETTVFLFFLGHECTHCMNQLNTFAPMAGRLRTAGAQIVAISADDAAGVASTFAGTTPEATQQRFPFLILADKHQKAFRAWGVYDQFTQAPIHGVFIVDAAGRLRWRHLGVEPFLQVGDVLAACERIGNG